MAKKKSEAEEKKKPASKTKPGAKKTAAKKPPAKKPPAKKPAAKKTAAKKPAAKKTAAKKITTPKKATKPAVGKKTTTKKPKPIPRPPLPRLDVEVEGAAPEEELLDFMPPEAALEAAPEAELQVLTVGGGAVIKGRGGEGTATIACRKISEDGAPVLSLLTAAHVVNDEPHSKVVTLDGSTIGEVSQVGGSDGTPIDVALIKITDGNQAHRDVIVGSNKFPIHDFSRPVAQGDEVRHGGPHGQNGTLTGKVTLLNAGQTTITRNKLEPNSTETYSVFGLMKIKPENAPQFGQPGDSGSPVFMKSDNDDGKFDLVGLLVAVDPDGFGYAQHMANLPGVQLGVAKLMAVRAL
jgi:hypothetical protein